MVLEPGPIREGEREGERERAEGMDNARGSFLKLHVHGSFSLGIKLEPREPSS